MQISLGVLVDKIIGPFAPTGCHARDTGRVERVEHVEELVCHLLAELSACADDKDDERDSVGRIGCRAHQALCAAVEHVNDDVIRLRAAELAAED
jgi:hypothetical protein